MQGSVSAHTGSDLAGEANGTLGGAERAQAPSEIAGPSRTLLRERSHSEAPAIQTANEWPRRAACKRNAPLQWAGKFPSVTTSQGGIAACGEPRSHKLRQGGRCSVSSSPCCFRHTGIGRTEGIGRPSPHRPEYRDDGRIADRAATRDRRPIGRAHYSRVAARVRRLGCVHPAGQRDARRRHAVRLRQRGNFQRSSRNSLRTGSHDCVHPTGQRDARRRHAVRRRHCGNIQRSTRNAFPTGSPGCVHPAGQRDARRRHAVRRHHCGNIQRSTPKRHFRPALTTASIPPANATLANDTPSGAANVEISSVRRETPFRPASSAASIPPANATLADDTRSGATTVEISSVRRETPFRSTFTAAQSSTTPIREGRAAAGSIRFRPSRAAHRSRGDSGGSGNPG